MAFSYGEVINNDIKVINCDFHVLKTHQRCQQSTILQFFYRYLFYPIKIKKQTVPYFQNLFGAPVLRQRKKSQTQDTQNDSLKVQHSFLRKQKALPINLNISLEEANNKSEIVSY